MSDIAPSQRPLLLSYTDSGGAVRTAVATNASYDPLSGRLRGRIHASLPQPSGRPGLPVNCHIGAISEISPFLGESSEFERINLPVCQQGELALPPPFDAVAAAEAANTVFTSGRRAYATSVFTAVRLHIEVVMLTNGLVRVLNLEQSNAQMALRPDAFSWEWE